MRKRRGYTDRFPRLPPGVTPSDLPGNNPQEVPPDERPDADPDAQPCHVCHPPDDDTGDWVFCDDHDMDDLQAKMGRGDHENPPPERWQE